jgi:hypothetical protein
MKRPDVKGFDYNTDCAPAWNFALGVPQLIFGWLIGGVGVLTIWTTLTGARNPARPSDVLIRRMYLAVAAPDRTKGSEGSY